MSPPATENATAEADEPDAEATAPDVRASAAPSPAPTAPDGELRDGLVGAWVLPGGACDSGEPIRLSADGGYATEGATGTWTLRGRTLTIVSRTTAAIGEGDAAPEEPGGAPVDVQTSLGVRAIEADVARLSTEDGQDLVWTRCTAS